MNIPTAKTNINHQNTKTQSKQAINLRTIFYKLFLDNQNIKPLFLTLQRRPKRTTVCLNNFTCIHILQVTQNNNRNHAFGIYLNLLYLDQGKYSNFFHIIDKRFPFYQFLNINQMFQLLCLFVSRGLLGEKTNLFQLKQITHTRHLR